MLPKHVIRRLCWRAATRMFTALEKDQAKTSSISTLASRQSVSGWRTQEIARMSSTLSHQSPGSEYREPSPEELEEDERKGREQEQKFRTYKKLFSTFLFGTTFACALYGRRRKHAKMAENLKNCTRLPQDGNFQGGHNEFFMCRNPAVPDSGCVLPGQIVKSGIVVALRSFDVRPTDIFVASFPKSGTTWIQEIVYLISHDLDFDKAAGSVLETRFPYLEFPYPGLTTVEKMPSPRLIKTHLPYDLLPPDVGNAKIIYIVRNPKDVVVSYYYFARMLAFASYHGSMAEFVEQFKRNQVPYTPYFGHVDSYLKRQEDPNILVVKYEDLSRDPAEVIKRIGEFMERPLSSEDINRLVTHTEFQNMAQNPSVNYSHWDELGLRNENETRFLRNGKVGDWHNYFSGSTNKSFEEWIQSGNKMGHNFEFDL